MSWNASGVIEGEAESLDAVDPSGLTFSPPREDLKESAEEQVEFVLDTLSEGFSRGVIDGKYSVSLSGHSDPDQENDRKRLSIALNPTT